MTVIIPQIDNYLAIYRGEIDVIPIRGGFIGEKRFGEKRWWPKRPGYFGWDNPELKFTDEQLRNSFRETQRLGSRCGVEFGNHIAIDFDLEKCLKGLSLVEVRKFRKSLIPVLRELHTPVAFTPGGGFHVHFRTKHVHSPKKLDSVVGAALSPLFAVDDRVRPELVRGAQRQEDLVGMVLIPPSIISPDPNYIGHTGAYFWLDSVQTLQNFSLREL